MATTIPHQELDGYPIERRTIEGFRATRKLVCAWDQRATLRGDLIGGAVGEGPQVYPYNLAWGAVVRSVEVEPYGGQRKGSVTGLTSPSSYLATYDKALLTVEYSTPTGRDEPQVDADNPNPSSYFAETFEIGVEHITLDYSKFKWTTADQDLEPGEAPTKIVAQGSYTLTHYYTPYFPDGLDDLPGTVNSGVYTAKQIYKSSGNKKTWAAGTMLMLPMRIETVTDSTGKKSLNITYTMAWRKDGWNKFFDAQNGTWDTISKKDGGAVVSIYQSDSFAGMTA